MFGARRVVAVIAAALAAGLPLLVPEPGAAAASGGGEHTGRVWASISAGREHTCGIRLDRTLWCWGTNGNGQLGLGETVEGRLVPTQVGRAAWLQVNASDFGHTCGIQADHSLWCWGYNSSGQLGTGDDDYRYVPTRVEGSAEWVAVSTGYGHTCAIRGDRSLWCWGDNSVGQLGIGSDAYAVYDPTQEARGFAWTQLSAGGNHTCALRDDSSLWCWGWNGDGQLGLGDIERSRARPAHVGTRTDWTQVSAGYAFTCGIRANATVWCTGENASGQLGVGDRTNRYYLTRVPGAFWAEVSAGGSHACARTVDGALFCWGHGRHGQLGYGGQADQTSPLRMSPRTDWALLATGGGHTCAIRTSHGLLCWGWNLRGQLGIDSTRRKLVPRVV